MAHGRIVIDVERCKGCELCCSACPQGVINLADYLNKKGYRPAVLLDPENKCTGCALCAVVCPDACIRVYREVGGHAVRSKEEARRHVRTTA
jgi:2-oxoglutarate ferredoxin oxidoreductase subunit delta